MLKYTCWGRNGGVEMAWARRRMRRQGQDCGVKTVRERWHGAGDGAGRETAWETAWAMVRMRWQGGRWGRRWRGQGPSRDSAGEMVQGGRRHRRRHGRWHRRDGGV